MGRVLSKQEPMRVARCRISDSEDARIASDSIQRGDAVLVVSVYPWGLEFEVEATETAMPDPREETTSA